AVATAPRPSRTANAIVTFLIATDLPAWLGLRNTPPGGRGAPGCVSHTLHECSCVSHPTSEETVRGRDLTTEENGIVYFFYWGIPARRPTSPATGPRR